MKIELLDDQYPWFKKAEYSEAELEEHKGNILIEALPPFRPASDIADKITRLPKYNVKERNCPVWQRMQMVLRLSLYVETLADHYDVIDQIGLAVRNGYVPRNPLNEAHYKETVLAYRRSLKGDICPIELDEPTCAASFALFGLSGMGKSTMVERALKFLPPVLFHEKHNINQLVWLKVSCPPDGSLKQLLMIIVDKINRLCGSQYVLNKKYTPKERARDELIIMVANIARLHNLGILVIDEIQNLLEAELKDRKIMLNFFVNFNDAARIPILTIGTKRAEKLLVGTFRQARRIGDHGTYEWLNLLEADEEWEHFMESMWKYQWTKMPTKLTKAIMEIFYKYTIGILSLVVRLYQLVQLQAIRDGIDMITPAHIAEVAKSRFRLITPMIEAVRKRDYKAIATYEDLFIRGMEKLDKDINEQGKGQQKVAAADTKKRHADKVMRSISTLMKNGYQEARAQKLVEDYFDSHPDASYDEAVKEIRKESSPDGFDVEITGDSLKEIVAKGKANGSDPAESLTKAGLKKKVI